jgi:cytochrome c peroxidase
VGGGGRRSPDAARRGVGGRRPPPAIGPLPPVPVPADNPLTPEQVELGRRLLFAARLSADGSLACVSCHLPDQGWATQTPLSPAYPTTMERRLAPTLVNVAYNQALLWDGRASTLEQQALGPIQHPLQMNQNLDWLVEKLTTIPDDAARFQTVFGTAVSAEGIGQAIAAFERTLVTRPAPVDRSMAGDPQAMSASAQRGMALFTGQARCIRRHHGPTVTDRQFHTLGVPEAPLLAHPLVQAALRFDAKRMQVPESAPVTEDGGRYLVTKDVRDTGAFKTPTLRNVRQREPSMHNGVFHALEDILDCYDRGGGAVAGTSPHLQALG